MRLPCWVTLSSLKCPSLCLSQILLILQDMSYLNNAPSRHYIPGGPCSYLIFTVWTISIKLLKSLLCSNCFMCTLSKVVFSIPMVLLTNWLPNLNLHSCPSSLNFRLMRTGTYLTVTQNEHVQMELLIFTTETFIFQPHYPSSSLGQKSKSDSWFFSPSHSTSIHEDCWCYYQNTAPVQPLIIITLIQAIRITFAWFFLSLLNDLSASTPSSLEPILHRVNRMIYSKPKSD